MHNRVSYQQQQPSNHLDTETLDTLVDAIKGWPGTVVVVSHNRPFVESIDPTHTGVVKVCTLPVLH
jgi:ATPase subunit of ABC transporter with duplicated ATPase domains